MAETSNTTRRIRIHDAHPVGFDERNWPVNCALLILAGFAAGIIIATSQFDDPRLLHNAWFRLGTLLVSTGALFWIAGRTTGAMRRRMQLCLLVSVLVHTWMAMYLHRHYLKMTAEAELQHNSIVIPMDPVTIPEYYRSPEEERGKLEDFEQPVDVETPLASDPELLDKRLIEPTPPRPEERTQRSEDLARSQRPDPLQIERAQLPAPRRADTMAGGQISRQDLHDAPQPDEVKSEIERLSPKKTAQNQLHAPRSSDDWRPHTPQTFTQRPNDSQPRQARLLDGTDRPVQHDWTQARAEFRDDPTTDRRPTDPAPHFQDRTEPLQRFDAAPSQPPRELNPARQDIEHRAARPESASPTMPRPLPQMPVKLTTPDPRRMTTPRDPDSGEPTQGPRQRTAQNSVAPQGIAENQSPTRLPASTTDRANPFDLREPGAAGEIVRSQPALPDGSDARSDIVAMAPTAERLLPKSVSSGPDRARSQPHGAESEDDPASPTQRPNVEIEAAADGSPQEALTPGSSGGNPRGSGPDLPRSDSALRHGGTGGPTGNATTRGEDQLAMATGSAHLTGPLGGSRVRGRSDSAPFAGALESSRGRRSATDLLPEADAATGGSAGGELSPHPTGSPTTTADPTPPSAGTPSDQLAAKSMGTSPSAPTGGIGQTPSPLGAATPIGDLLRAHRQQAQPTGADAGGGNSPARRPGSSTPIAAVDADLGPSETGAPGGESLLPKSADSDLLAHVDAGEFARSMGAAPRTAAGQSATAADVSPGTLRLEGSPLGDPRNARPEPTAVDEPAAAANRAAGPAAGVDDGGEQAQSLEPVETAAGHGESTPDFGPTLDTATTGGGNLPVRISAALNKGGLDVVALPQLGLPTRRARRESEIVHTAVARFLLPRSGGEVFADGTALENPAAAFSRRDPGLRGQESRKFGGTREEPEAVERGLAFLADCQFPDGHWSFTELPDGAGGPGDAALGDTPCDTAATGLALLSYLGFGYTHIEQKYRDQVRHGIDWLVTHQEDNGDLFSRAGGNAGTRFYSHGIATIALCEAYGMTRDPDLREPAQKAIQYIVDSQDPKHGGWRYTPRVQSDTSVTGWQLMALKSAQMAGLDVPQETLDGVRQWLDYAQAENDPSQYRYNPEAEDTEQWQRRHGRVPNRAMTAEGLLMRMYLGWKLDHPSMIKGADYLKANLPQLGANQRRETLRDAYYWYYATQVMIHMQGDHWKTWHDRLEPLLTKSQIKTGPWSGSWHPKGSVPDRWGAEGGRLYVTTMNLLMLEVSYRKLPLFDVLGEKP
ncbi:MAG: hypothetical protein HQ581_19585 [Planctomycetes bacterium]|nr:hypothetical protein [Planctomycetota bacterium]